MENFKDTIDLLEKIFELKKQMDDLEKRTEEFYKKYNIKIEKK